MQQAPDTGRARRPDDVLRGLPVHPVERLLPLLGDDSNQVNDRVAPGEGPREAPGVEHVSHRDLHRVVVAVVRPGRLPRQDRDGVPAPKKGVDDVGSDEPGPACNQDFQLESPRCVFNITAAT